MLDLHCTKKLLTKLPLTDEGRIISRHPSLALVRDLAANPLSGWQGYVGSDQVKCLKIQKNKSESSH